METTSTDNQDFLNDLEEFHIGKIDPATRWSSLDMRIDICRRLMLSLNHNLMMVEADIKHLRENYDGT